MRKGDGTGSAKGGPAGRDGAWERFMQAERKELGARAQGQLGRALGAPLPGESAGDLGRAAREDARLAGEGLVELRDPEGRVSHKPLEEIGPEDRWGRLRAHQARADWLQERLRRRGG